MATFTVETILPAPLDRVWAFYEDVRDSLPLLSPPADQVHIEPFTGGTREGLVLVIRARGPLGRVVRWVARYVEVVPPHAVVFGAEARFVDVQDEGPFKRWRHSHEFEALDDRTTRQVDRIEYAVGWGPVGWLADVVVVRPKLRAMFAYRRQQLLKRFSATC
ncbi:MAG TPA: SRPBCC family protein [Tepidisphaeraceae bacterium]|nr:SRPBCC family protein [Tepidisphaeraceae bacterium]